MQVKDLARDLQRASLLLSKDLQVEGKEKQKFQVRWSACSPSYSGV